MSDGMDSGGGRFGALDPNLTVFALANGVDLRRADGNRMLEWFSEGLERGVLIEALDDGFTLTALTWRASQPQLRSESQVADGLSPSEVRSALPDAIDAANALTAPPS